MKAFLIMVSIALGLWGFMVVIQGALGVGLLISAAVIFSAACLGFWIEDYVAEVKQLLTEIRDRLPPPVKELPGIPPMGEAYDADQARARNAQPQHHNP